MPRVTIIKIYDCYYENSQFLSNVVKDSKFQEVTNEELIFLTKNIHKLNKDDWRKYVVVEEVPESAQDLIVSISDFIKEEQRKAAVEEENRRLAKEKRTLANAENERKKKLRQLEKLKKELGEK